MVVGSASGHLHFLDAASLAPVAPARLVTASWVLDLQLSPDGRLLAVMGSDGDVTLYDTSTWRPYGKPFVDKLGWGFLAFDGDVLRVYGGARCRRGDRRRPAVVGQGRVPGRQHASDPGRVRGDPPRGAAVPDVPLTSAFHLACRLSWRRS